MRKEYVRLSAFFAPVSALFAGPRVRFLAAVLLGATLSAGSAQAESCSDRHANHWRHEYMWHSVHGSSNVAANSFRSWEKCLKNGGKNTPLSLKTLDWLNDNGDRGRAVLSNVQKVEEVYPPKDTLPIFGE